MWDMLSYLVPWWAWLIVLAVGLGVLGFFWRNIYHLLILAGGALAVVLYLRAGQQGYNAHKDKTKKHAKELDDEYKEIDARPSVGRDDDYDRM